MYEMMYINIDDVTAKSSANGLVGTGFTSLYWHELSSVLKSQWVGVKLLHKVPSHYQLLQQ